MQVDPIKPMSKAPETKRSKLRYDGPLSNFSVNFDLRRYIWGRWWRWVLNVLFAARPVRILTRNEPMQRLVAALAGADTRSPFSSSVHRITQLKS